ncbi:Uncharacterized protein BM_BM13108 [Brugia malayi]|uniref:Bm13108 n=2 Tax=Brugia TaxID=6278 RepID=A0A0H5S8M9_BRUMA|nr:Uncharacterized protein BM_BM13108 [Brugia malayi]CRZ24509.1 Bm13108 [Brugia malayi]VDO48125.1 unnamed protein product [Brugia timori]VIO98448.1 Uncharacterized protein BM_BM13108 [Brugia malayi]
MENVNKNNAVLFFPYPSISMYASFTGPFVIVGLYNGNIINRSTIICLLFCFFPDFFVFKISISTHQNAMFIFWITLTNKIWQNVLLR